MQSRRLLRRRQPAAERQQQLVEPRRRQHPRLRRRRERAGRNARHRTHPNRLLRSHGTRRPRRSTTGTRLTGKQVQLESADYIISGSITSLGFDQSGTGVGALLARYVPVLGGVEYKSIKAHLNLDLRLIDTHKAKILASKTFQGDNQRSGFGIGGLGFAGGMALGGNHSSISGTPAGRSRARRPGTRHRLHHQPTRPAQHHRTRRTQV
ncbi:MAG: CsgG/HfaB family protein [Sulfuricella sp.]